MFIVTEYAALKQNSNFCLPVEKPECQFTYMYWYYNIRIGYTELLKKPGTFYLLQTRK